MGIEQPVLRAITVADAEELAVIDAAAVDFPWRPTQFTEGLLHGETGWCLESRGIIHAFAVYSMLFDEATLLNIAVRPDAQRQGFGRLLLSHTLDQCRALGAARLLLEVRAGNMVALTLYQQFGFEIDGRRRGYYPALSGREDAILMSKSLIASDTPSPAV